MIIALSGKAGSGKTTVANHLVKRYGFTRIPLAAPLKAMVTAVIEGCLDEGVVLEKDTLIFQLGMTYGALLQFIGSAIREKRVDFFVELWEMRFANSRVLDVVVDDVRYKNEREFFQHFGAYEIRLEKLDFRTGVLAEPPNDGRDALHSSEVDLDGILDWEKVWRFSDGDVEGLKQETDKFVSLRGCSPKVQT